jgi:hypothetical protein
MKRVRLLQEPNYSEKIKKFIALGEPVPTIGEVYTVSGYIHLEDVSEHPHLVENGITDYRGYFLEEFDWSELGISLGFNRDLFEVVSEKFTPNDYIVEPHFEGHVETFTMHTNFKFDFNDNE